MEEARLRALKHFWKIASISSYKSVEMEEAHDRGIGMFQEKECL